MVCGEGFNEEENGNGGPDTDPEAGQNAGQDRRQDEVYGLLHPVGPKTSHGQDMFPWDLASGITRGDQDLEEKDKSDEKDLGTVAYPEQEKDQRKKCDLGYGVCEVNER